MSRVLLQTRDGEVYALECWRCSSALELPTASEGTYCCPGCQAPLAIEWCGSNRPQDSLLPSREKRNAGAV